LLARAAVVLLGAAASAGAQTAVPDLRGIWEADQGVDADLEAAKVIVEPGNGKIPYRGEALGKRQENFAQRATADPRAKCHQAGVPRATYVPSPFQIFQTEGRVIIVYQDVHAYRVIFTDGRPHYQGIEFYMGDSRGRWEGSSLVVDVRNFHPGGWLDSAGNYASGALRVVERYTRRGPAAMVYEATIEDPEVFSAGWKIRVPLRRHTEPGFQLVEDECVEDGRGVRHRAPPFKAQP
jgi:hypothetical protein